MNVGDKVRDILFGSPDIGELVYQDAAHGCLVEYGVQKNGRWSPYKSVQSANITPILKKGMFYYWYAEAELVCVGKAVQASDLSKMIQPIFKMVSGCRCSKCNDFNEYVEVPETQVKSWICTPCKS